MMAATSNGARARRRRGREAGFSLIELSIALVAGLMVAMAVMGVTKEATNTFHEEARVSGAEMALRIASERLRMDLQRAAFMGTGNVVGDPLTVRNPNYGGTSAALANITGTVPYSLQHLSGIALNSGGASAVLDGNSSAQLTANVLTPDTIDIAGNFATTDEYVASVIWPIPPLTASPPCLHGPAISLQMNTPAMWRILNAEAAGAATVSGYVAGTALQAAFHPGQSTASQFLLRLTDPTGRYQFMVMDTGGPGAGTVLNASQLPTTPNAVVCLDANSKILQTKDTGGLGGVAGFGTGWVVVSPLQIVRWDVQSLATLAPLLNAAMSAASITGPSYAFGATLTVDKDELVLTRSYVDFAGCGSSGPCKPDLLTTEIVAEYAVDLKFGLTIDEYPNPLCAAFPCPITAPSYPKNYLTTLSMDGTATLQSSPYAKQAATAYTANVGPQRIRDVQTRIGIRSRYPDRTLTLTPPASTGYVYRYKCPWVAGAVQWARVRESTTEVNLANQARFYW